MHTDAGDVVTCSVLHHRGRMSVAPRTFPTSRASTRSAGAWHHTGAWPREGVDFTGKRVAVIGTGSTGIQADPRDRRRGASISPCSSGHRTTAFRPATLPLTAEQTRDIKANYPAIRAQVAEVVCRFPVRRERQCRRWRSPPEERQETYERLWDEAGGFKFMYGSYNDLLFDKEAERHCS